jgi:septal ring factor EnvC (AmiA/AmiB activator)
MCAFSLRSLVSLAMLVLVFAALPALGADRRQDSERELEAIQGRIRSLEKDISRAAATKPTAGRALQEAELAEGDARAALREIRKKIAAGRAREEQLRGEMRRAEAELADHRVALEWQLRLAYTSGREEWLRLALAQQDPVELSRRVVYYGYITRHRSTLLQQVQDEIHALEESAARLKEELDELADLGRRQEARVREVAAARRVRAEALATLDRDLGARKEKLTRLRKESRALQDLMARLARESRAASPPAPAVEPQPERATGPQLEDLPLRGTTVARFGQPRSDGLLRWEGLMLAAPAGSDVKAVRGGRVVYSDWLPGMGLLLVIDHGKGYMSLYGHNQDLLKKTGQTVKQGETIAKVGDTGGQGNPGLYFELRRNGKPVNPQSWVR